MSLFAKPQTDWVLRNIAVERQRQDEKWGEVQPGVEDGTGEEYEPFAVYTKERCQAAEGPGQTWVNILLEEVGEALVETDSQRLREELVQVAAVAVKWVEAIDRRST